MDVIIYPYWLSKSQSVKQAPAICARYISLMSPVKRRWGLRWVQRRVNALHIFRFIAPYVISYNVYTSMSYRAWSVLLNTQYAYHCFNVFGFPFSDELPIWQRHKSSCLTTFQTNSKKSALLWNSLKRLLLLIKYNTFHLYHQKDSNHIAVKCFYSRCDEKSYHHVFWELCDCSAVSQPSRQHRCRPTREYESETIMLTPNLRL